VTEVVREARKAVLHVCGGARGAPSGGVGCMASQCRRAAYAYSDAMLHDGRGSVNAGVWQHSLEC